MNRALVGVGCVLLCACSGAAAESEAAPAEATGSSAAALRSDAVDVDFQGCREMASLAPAPVAKLRPLVPAAYQLANEASGTGFVVVRVASCANVVIDGTSDGPGTVAQVGANLVSPDGTGDINNYTLWYYTTSPRLLARLVARGVNAQLTRDLKFAVTPTGGGNAQLAVDVPGRPAFSVSGPIALPTAPAVPYIANWWRDHAHDTARMNTVLPAIQFSSAHLTLATNPGNALGQLFGAGSVTFPIFDSFNAFPAAHMVVADTR
jgi:hypothetical protein